MKNTIDTTDTRNTPEPAQEVTPAELLEAELNGYTCTDHYYKLPFFRRPILFTDGARDGRKSGSILAAARNQHCSNQKPQIF